MHPTETSNPTITSARDVGLGSFQCLAAWNDWTDTASPTILQQRLIVRRARLSPNIARAVCALIFGKVRR